MKSDLDIMVAQSLDAPVELLPYLGELFSEIWALGGSPDVTVQLLRPLDLPPSETRLLDVGCGKGAVAITVARELGFAVHGVDGYGPFIEQAKARAQAEGVDALCTFECGDMRETLRRAQGFDVVVFASHGPMLDGRPCIEVLRDCVRSGGYLLIDDGFLAEGITDPPTGYDDYLPYDQTLDRLTTSGDCLVAERLLSIEKRDADEQHTISYLAIKAHELSARLPQLASMLQEYIRHQRAESQKVFQIHVPAMWLIQKV